MEGLRVSRRKALLGGVLASVSITLVLGCSGDTPTPLAEPRGPDLVTSPTGRDAAPPTEPEPLPPRPRGPLPPRTVALDVDLGRVLAGTPVKLDVPANALGFNVVVRGEDDEDEVSITRVTSPSGEVVLRDAIVVGGTFESAKGLRIAAAEVPQNRLASTVPLEKGAWSITVAGKGTLSVSARVQISGDGEFHGGALDMHVYLPRGLVVEDPGSPHVVDAARAERDASIEARLDAFYRALEATTGIVRGDVTFHDVDPSFRRIATKRALDAAFAASAGVVADGHQSVHVMLTNELAFGNGTWGVASGIPGAATRTGTRASGVALALTGDNFASADGLALLHEVGHFVGLNHTTELVAGYADPLADTPSCSETIDRSRPSTFASCPDKDNLMFPTLVSESLVLSDTQRTIFRGSPVFRAFVGPETDAGAPDGGESDAALPDAGPRALVPRRGLPVLRLTRSGRALSAEEAIVLSGSCGTEIGVPYTRGPALSREVLLRIAKDPDLAGIVRQRAARLAAHAPEP
ncbi:MAG: hypothetical protein IPK71_07480 [Myxococcales bacterium]|nr:hypothetical protein [Myxococcales bacterium]